MRMTFTITLHLSIPSCLLPSHSTPPPFSLSTPQPYPYHCIPSYFQGHHTCQAHHFPISHAHLAHHHTHISIATYPYQPILHLLTLITPIPTYLSLYHITPIPCMHQFSHVLDRTSSDLFNEHEENGKPAVLIRFWMMSES